VLVPQQVVIPAKAGIQYVAAFRFHLTYSGILDRPPSRATTVDLLQTQFHDLAAYPREFCWKNPALLDQRAQGMPGARRARSLACKIKKHTSIVTTVTPDSPGIPCAMVLTVSFVLSPVTGLVCHRHRRIGLRQLDASVGASGPHDFAVRCNRRSSARRLARPNAAASTASRPASVTIASRPSGDGTKSRYSCFYQAVKLNSEIPKLDRMRFRGSWPG
jgi:hypothetical protein